MGIFLFSFNRVGSVNTDCSEDSIFGFAWSDNVGWISFCGSNYGVEIDDEGYISGKAWSDALGWISFTDVGGCPEVPCVPRFDMEEGEITGWAKVLDPEEWISLSGEGYGILYDEGSLSGYSFGDGFLGWMSWDMAGYYPYPKPVVSNLDVSHPPDYCEITPQVTLNWDYEDFGGGYSRSEMKINADEFTTSSEGGYVYTNLDYSSSYVWEIRSRNDHGLWSDWVSTTFETLPEYPDSSFTWEPSKPIVDKEVIFSDSGGDFDTRSWTFEGGDPEESSEASLSVVFEIEGPKEVTLTVTKDGLSCTDTEIITVRPPLPDDWREVDPF